ncbi:MAG TPA: OmpA family protein [Myxococcaceae bacterium]|nr:OmpA family protein [Myxococcaceae bacterium]
MRTPLKGLLAACVLLAACHPTKEEFAAKELEAATYMKKLQDESQKTADLEKKVADLTAKVAQLETDRSALEADKKALEDQVKAGEGNLSTKQQELRSLQTKVAELQALNDELSRSKKKLEQAKQELEKKSSEYEQLAGSLKSEIETGKIELSELKGKMTVKLHDKVLFASGSATLGKEGKDALGKIADAFKNLSGKVIRVEGHTDNLPIASEAFPTNWELSTARALAVVRFLQEKGVDPTKLAAAGYSQYQPVAENETPEGRSQNRRIEIVLAPADAPTTPQTPSAPASTSQSTTPAPR